jgi:hypothetical protein
MISSSTQLAAENSKLSAHRMILGIAAGALAVGLAIPAVTDKVQEWVGTDGDDDDQQAESV